MKIKYKGITIVEGVVHANDFWSRLSGYMFRSHPHVPGIMFEPCNAIHTSFMNFHLDLVFLSADNKIIKIVKDLKPWRHTWFYFDAKKTLELPAGLLPPELKEGEVLEVEHV